LDTSISSFHQYQVDGSRGIVTNGNMGLATSSLFYPNSSFGFNWGEHSFDIQKPGWNDDVVYDTKVPFVRAAYVSGPKKYQDFNLLFTQNISSQMNFSFKLNSFGGDGFYLNQSTSTRYFSIQNNYSTRSNRYGYFVKFDVQSAKIEENGGMKGDSIYLNSLQDDKLNVQVWFDQNSANHYDKREVEVNQYFRLSKPQQSDSTSGYFLFMKNEGAIYDFWYENQIADSGYFEQLFDLAVPDSVLLVDKSKLLKIENDLGFKYISKSGVFEGVAGIHVGYYAPENYFEDTTFLSSHFFAKISKLQLQKWLLQAEARKGVSGFNSEGYHFTGTLEHPLFSNSSTVKLKVLTQKNLPEFKMMWYAGSLLEWNTAMDYVQESELLIQFRSKPWNVELNGKIAAIQNYAYYGINSIPVQSAEGFNRFEVSFKKNFIVKSYHLDLSLQYQMVEEGAPVNIPTWWWNANFYYQRYLFDHALELRYGIDYWQNSAYTADNYAPFTRSFTLQNDYQIGNHPYIDFYISARIKSAQGFVKFQNVGQLFFEQPYMMVPYYSMQDFAFSWGLRWDFYN
jgi:hypothetical protein